MKTREIVEAILSSGIKNLLRDSNFRKSRLNFTRRRGKVIQVINIQLSQYNFVDSGYFYINIGLAFDQLREFEARPIVEKPKVYQCDFRRRLEYLISDTPHEWKITTRTDAAFIANQLRTKIITLVSILDPINSLSRFLTVASKSNWFAVPGEYSLLARLHRAMGDITNAEKYEHLAQEYMHNRETMSPEEFLEHYGFDNVLRSE